MSIQNNLDDVEEFMEQALKAIDPEDDCSQSPERPSSFMSKSEKKKYEGSFNQWASLGGQAFIPATDTIKTLPPDCYHISISPQGELVFIRQNIVTDSLMRLPDSRGDEVISEVEKFWTLKDKFQQYGFAHKRGFLLFGPPGSGKTSTTAIIINDMIKKGGLVILGDNPHILSNGLNKLRVIEQNRPVVVILEDLDTIIQNFGEAEVLSVLDGEKQIENVVYIATTNYPENLDGRITNRPSRFDRIIKISTPNAAARAMYLKAKIEHTTMDGIDLVAETEGLSIAHIKELIVATKCQGNPVADVLKRLQLMKVLPKSSGNEFENFGLGKRK